MLERDLKKSAVDEVDFNFCRSTGSDGNIKVLFSWKQLFAVLYFLLNSKAHVFELKIKLENLKINLFRELSTSDLTLKFSAN